MLVQLAGNQINSESSVDAYINALKLGCRCVERMYHLSYNMFYTSRVASDDTERMWQDQLGQQIILPVCQCHTESPGVTG